MPVMSRPFEHDGAGRRRHFAVQHLEEGRLAGAIGPDDAAQLAAVHREVDIAIGQQTAITFGQMTCREDRPLKCIAKAAMFWYRQRGRPIDDRDPGTSLRDSGGCADG